MTQIFVYGTLKDEQIRKMVLGYDVPAEEDVLEKIWDNKYKTLKERKKNG